MRITERPDWLSSTLASDAHAGRGVLAPGLRALDPARTLIAPAHVVAAGHNDNLAVNEVVKSPPPPGRVLVVGGHATSVSSTIGDLMARELRQAGLVGLVTDGLVRDAREIRDLGFPVWCRGTTPMASEKREPGVRGGAVHLGGQVVREGDWIIADEDGVVCWPAAEVEELVSRAEAKKTQDEARLARLHAQG